MKRKTKKIDDTLTSLIDAVLLDFDWGTIDELLDHACTDKEISARLDKVREACADQDIREAADFVDKFEDVGRAWLKRKLRNRIKVSKDRRGRPLYESVVDEKDGKRNYKQLTMFTVEDFKQVSQYHAGREKYHKRRVEELAEQCFEQLSVQLELPW